jgi:putative phosphoesterase
MRIGVLSDTHNRLPPTAVDALRGTQHILHAGDVCRPSIIDTLATLAPVTVVAGNNDHHPGWRPTELVELNGIRFLLEHIVHPRFPTPAFRQRLALAQPQVVVFGHTHQPFCERLEGILFLNPGSAGSPRFGVPASLCLLDLTQPILQPQFITLPD